MIGDKQFFQEHPCYVTLSFKTNMSCCLLTLCEINICSVAQNEQVKAYKLSQKFNKLGNVRIALFLELSPVIASRFSGPED